MWDKFHNKYGGREFRRKSIAVPTDDPSKPDYLVELQLRTFKIITWPRVKYFRDSIRVDVYCSRSDTVRELIHRLCSSDIFDKKSNLESEML